MPSYILVGDLRQVLEEYRRQGWITFQQGTQVWFLSPQLAEAHVREAVDTRLVQIEERCEDLQAEMDTLEDEEERLKDVVETWAARCHDGEYPVEIVRLLGLEQFQQSLRARSDGS